MVNSAMQIWDLSRAQKGLAIGKTSRLVPIIKNVFQKRRCSFYLVFDFLLEFSSPAFTIVFFSKT